MVFVSLYLHFAPIFMDFLRAFRFRCFLPTLQAGIWIVNRGQ